MQHSNTMALQKIHLVLSNLEPPLLRLNNSLDSLNNSINNLAQSILKTPTTMAPNSGSFVQIASQAGITVKNRIDKRINDRIHGVIDEGLGILEKGIVKLAKGAGSGIGKLAKGAGSGIGTFAKGTSSGIGKLANGFSGLIKTASIFLKINPWVLTVIAIGIIIGLIYLLIKHWDTVKKVVVSFFITTWDIFKKLIDIVAQFNPGIILIRLAIGRIIETWQYFQGLFDAFQVGGVTTAIEYIKDSFFKCIAYIQELFTNLFSWDFWKDQLDGFVGKVSGVFSFLIDPFTKQKTPTPILDRVQNNPILAEGPINMTSLLPQNDHRNNSISSNITSSITKPHREEVKYSKINTKNSTTTT
ncbi:MAG: hypothetical protein ACRC4N_12585, partial [Gammaproteobacteria bacterium]